jgi:hypothetical protein
VPADRGRCSRRPHSQRGRPAANHARSPVSSICGARGAGARAAPAFAQSTYGSVGRGGSGPAPACASSGWPACHLCGGPFRSISRGPIYRVKSPVQRVHGAEIQPGVGGDAGNSRIGSQGSACPSTPAHLQRTASTSSRYTVTRSDAAYDAVTAGSRRQICRRASVRNRPTACAC